MYLYNAFHIAVLPLQAYERGVGMFKWPHVNDIWNTYLTKFIERYVSATCCHDYGTHNVWLCL